MGDDFENVAVARALGMSDLEMQPWLEFGAHRKLRMLMKHMQNSQVHIQHVVLLVFYRRVRESTRTRSQAQPF